MTKSDATFDDVSLYGSEGWTARRLGRSRDWLRQHKDTLTSAGLPEPDPITGLRLKRAVDEWAVRRAYRSGALPMEAHGAGSATHQEEKSTNAII